MPKDDDGLHWDDWESKTDISKKPIDPAHPVKKRKPFQLEKVHGPGSPATFTLEGDQLMVGRMEGVEIQLDSPQVSRRHMLLKKNGNEYSCIDLNSQNGIFLNGIKIHSAVLKEGDSLQLGDVVLIYHEGN